MIIDCRNTKNFLKELQRCCSYHGGSVNNCRTEDGILCPLYDDVACDTCESWMTEQPETAILCLQTWSDDHQKETIEEHFNRILPAMRFDYYSDLCCRNLDSTLSEPPDGCECDEASCRECWNRPYEDSILPF